MKSTLAFAAGLLLALSAPLTAQQRITGKVLRAPTVSCDATATHMLEHTDVLLKSTTINLTTWENKNVDLEGTLITTPTCATLDVTTAANAQYAHTVTAANQFKLGTNVTFKGTSPFLGFVGIIFSGARGFLPVATYGALLIDPLNYVLIGPNLALLGSYSTTVQIPNDPALIGGLIQTQSFWATVTTTYDGALVNTFSFTIKP